MFYKLAFIILFFFSQESVYFYPCSKREFLSRHFQLHETEEPSNKNEKYKVYAKTLKNDKFSFIFEIFPKENK